MDKDKALLTKVHQLRSAASRIYQEKWDSALENARFYRLTQYSDQQLSKFTSNKRVPYVLDYVSNTMNTYLGIQRDGRTDVAYLPVEQGDEVKVEVLNSVKDSTMRANTFQFLESDVFQDGLIEKMGVMGYEWSTERNPLGELRMFRIPPRQMVWDLNRRDYSLDMAQWISRTRLYSKKTLAKKFPDHADDIMKLSMASNILDAMGLDATYMKQIIDSELDSIALIEWYERDYKDKYFIEDLRTEAVSDKSWKTRKGAERAIKDQLQEFEQTYAAEIQARGIKAQTPQLRVRPESQPIVRKSEVLHYLVLTNEEVADEPFYPYDCYYPYWHDGEWWAVMDTFKDAQRFVNKTFMMIDNQMTRGVKGLLLIDDGVPEQQAKQLQEMFSTTGGSMRLKDPQHNVHFIPPSGFDPRLISAMEVAIGNMDKKAGGANFLGQKESAGESGVAVERRIAQGSMSSFVIYDNLSRWKKSVGEKIMWYLSNYMTAAQKVRIEGQELTQYAAQKFPQWFQESMRPHTGFLTINTVGENTLTGLKADVIIEEAKHSVSKNAATLQQIAGMMQSSPTFAQSVPPELVWELSDLPSTIKEQVKQRSIELQKQAQAQAQAEVSQKPPQVSATLGDIEKLDAMEKEQFLQKFFGIQSSGQPQADEKTKQVLIQGQLASDAQEKELALKYQKHKDQTELKLISLAGEHNLREQEIKQKGKSNASQE